MHAQNTPSSKLYFVNSLTASKPWRKLGFASVLATALLSACGGGGGGGSTTANGNNDQGGMGASGLAYTGDFPIGLALASPAGLANSSSLVAGGLAIVDPGLNTVKTLQQVTWASQADAVATGRLSIATSGLLSVSSLFDTSSRVHSSCYGPAVAYLNHDDSSTSGTLPSGDVAMWMPEDSDSSPLSCGASELNALTGTQTAQIQQSLLLTSAMRQLIASDPSHQTPTTATPLDMTSRASATLGPLLPGVTVSSATVSMASDPATGSAQYTYRLVLTRGSGSSAQSIDITLIHTNDFTNVVYLGALQITVGYLTADATIGCTDQMSNGLYKVAKLTSLFYNRHFDMMQLRAKSGQYCGNPTIGSSSHMTELASVTLSGELDVGTYLTSSTRGSTLGWRKNFSLWVQDVDLSPGTSDFYYVWQDQPTAGGNGQARVFGGTQDLDLNTQVRTLKLYHGTTADISTESYTLQGFMCNVSGPGSTSTIQPLFQYQTTNLSNSASNWATGVQNISYAPTNSCNASGTMSYDLDGDGSVAPGNGSGSVNALHTVTHGTVEAEMTNMGFTIPSLSL